MGDQQRNTRQEKKREQRRRKRAEIAVGNQRKEEAVMLSMSSKAAAASSSFPVDRYGSTGATMTTGPEVTRELRSLARQTERYRVKDPADAEMETDVAADQTLEAHGIQPVDM